MSNHIHRKSSERGPWGCTGGSVRYVQVCSCGAERHVCNCHQCREQNTDKGEWAMPKCDCCGKRHPLDQACK